MLTSYCLLLFTDLQAVILPQQHYQSSDPNSWFTFVCSKISASFTRRQCHYWILLRIAAPLEYQGGQQVSLNFIFGGSSDCDQTPFNHMCFDFAGLPIQVRDTGLSVKDDMPKSDVNKEYFTQNMEREVICSDH